MVRSWSAFNFLYYTLFSVFTSVFSSGGSSTQWPTLPVEPSAAVGPPGSEWVLALFWGNPVVTSSQVMSGGVAGVDSSSKCNLLESGSSQISHFYSLFVFLRYSCDSLWLVFWGLKGPLTCLMHTYVIRLEYPCLLLLSHSKTAEWASAVSNSTFSNRIQ